MRLAARFFSFPPCPASATIRPVRATAGPPASARADKRTFRKREDVDSGNVGTFLTVRLFGFAREIVRDPRSVHPRLPTASRKTETPGRAPSFRHPLRKAESHERVKNDTPRCLGGGSRPPRRRLRLRSRPGRRFCPRQTIRLVGIARAFRFNFQSTKISILRTGQRFQHD